MPGGNGRGNYTQDACGLDASSALIPEAMSLASPLEFLSYFIHSIYS